MFPDEELGLIGMDGCFQQEVSKVISFSVRANIYIQGAVFLTTQKKPVKPGRDSRNKKEVNEGRKINNETG